MAAREFGFELVDRVGRLPRRRQDARSIEVVRDTFERGVRCGVQTERRGGRGDDVARAGVGNAVGARDRAQCVGEFAATAGVGHVEDVRTLARDGQQRARVVGRNRGELRAQGRPRVGVALRCREAKKRKQPARAHQIERGRLDRPEFGPRFERELTQRRQASPRERAIVDQQQRVDQERRLVGRKRSAAQHVAQGAAGIDRVHERQQRAVLAAESPERLVFVAVDRRQGERCERGAAPNVGRDRQFVARGGDASHHGPPLAFAQHVQCAAARQERGR